VALNDRAVLPWQDCRSMIPSCLVSLPRENSTVIHKPHTPHYYPTWSFCSSPSGARTENLQWINYLSAEGYATNRKGILMELLHKAYTYLALWSCNGKVDHFSTIYGMSCDSLTF
jgi:hypothetical protein